VEDIVVSAENWSVFLEVSASSLILELDRDRLEKTDEKFLNDMPFNLFDPGRPDSDRVGKERLEFNRPGDEELLLERLAGEKVDSVGDGILLFGVLYPELSSPVFMVPARCLDRPRTPSRVKETIL
jgi:hypothetical protein